jgi:hypothetical protein
VLQLRQLASEFGIAIVVVHCARPMPMMPSTPLAARSD